MDGLAIETEQLRKRYGAFEAVRGVDLAIPHGEVFALLGPNGAGKTTTVEILEGYRQRTEGRAVDPVADQYPKAEDGLRSMAAVYAVVESGKSHGKWVDARPPMFR